MQITWHGHSCFELSNDKVTIVIDPHDGKSIGIRPPKVTADIVLMTHDHYDHNMAHVVRGDHKDFIFKNGKFECKGVEFTGLDTFHDKEHGASRGKNTMYLFKLDGVSICHCGDIGDIPSDSVLKAISKVDFLLLPIGGYYTMDNPDLKKFIELVNPKVTVPMHYRIGGLTISIADADEFLKMVPDESVSYVGNSIDISAEDLPESNECWVFDRR